MTAEEYAAYTNNVHITIGEEDDEKTFEEYIEDAFNAGMQEMHEQMMKDAEDLVVGIDANGLACVNVDGVLPDDTVRVLVIKED